MPTQIGYHFWPDWALVSGLRVDYFSPTIYLTDIVIIALFIFSTPLVVKAVRKTSTWIVVSVSLFVFLNLAISLNIPVSLYKIVRLAEFVFISWWVLKNKEFVFKNSSTPLLFAVGYTFVVSALQFGFGQTSGGFFYFLGERSFNSSTPGIALVTLFGDKYLRAYATFPHPNALAGFSVVSFFFLYLAEKKKTRRILGLAVCTANIALSFSLSALIAFGAGVLILITHFSKLVAKEYKQIVLAVVFGSLLLIPLSQKLLTEEVNFPENISNRLWLSAVAGEAISKNPFFGVGLGNYISYIPHAKLSSNLWLLQPVHNIFELVIAETGFVGVTLFIVLLLSLKFKDDYRKILLLLPILITGVADHYWLTLPQTTFLFAIVVGILF